MTPWKMKHNLCCIAVALAFASASEAEILMEIPGIKGTSERDGYEGWIPVLALSGGVDRDLAESGEKGGTEDINIGVGELGTVSISRESDTSTPSLWLSAINGNSIGTVEIHQLAQLGADSKFVPVAKWKLDRAFVKSLNFETDTFSRGSEELEFFFNKIAFGIRGIDGDGRSENVIKGWDNVRNKAWENHGLAFDDVKVGSPAMVCEPGDRLCGRDPLPGDANHDGSVTFIDFITLANNFGEGGTWSDGDFSGDGFVDFGDFLELAQHFGQRLPLLSAIPEPSSLLSLVLGLMLMLKARRRRR